MPDEPNAIVDTDDLSNYVNDYVRLTSEYDALQEEIDDISTYTSVTPEEVETTVVVPSDVYDGLVVDNSQNTPVPEEDDINLPEDPIDTVSYITEYRTVRYQLTRYDIEFLEYLHNDGATFYAILDDDSEVEIDYNDIIPPYGERLEEVVRYDDIIAETIGMNFWNDTNGVHVSQVEKDDWLQAVTDDFSDISVSNTYHNILMNSEGILLRRALLNLFAISRLAINFYDGTGNTANNVTASFGSTMAQIGKTNSNHVVITSNGVTAYKGDGTLDELTAIVDGANLKNATITGSKIASSTIENSNIKDGTIMGAKIQGSTLTNIPYAEIDQLKARNVSADSIQAATGFVSTLATNSITAAKLVTNQGIIDNLETNFAHIQNGVIDNADINVANVNGLSANYAHITNGVIDNAKIGHADVNGLSANYASVANLNAATGRITSLEASTADIDTIRANSAKVTNLTASQLEADHATVGSLDTNYAQINMANVNNTWIQNGTIKDAAISDGMINSVSANKLTAGTIDASNITVTNLNADNITTGTINGQRIGAGSLSLDKLEEDVYTETEVDSIVNNLQTQIDGAIETWTGTTIPTLQNAPASSWTTNSIKDTHVGDVYFVVNSQSNQNGYNYRFTKSGTGANATYSWQLIKDSDVTNALQRLTAAEGQITTIEQFDSDISSWKTDTDEEIASIKSNHTTLAGRVTTAEGDIATKVDTTTFNTLSQTVDTNIASISQLTTETIAITNKITLEKPYKEVEWVETTGRQFITTEYIPGKNGAFGFDADFIMRHTNYMTGQSWGSLTDASATNLSRVGIVFGVRQTTSDSYWQEQYAQYMLATDPKYGSSGSVMTGGGKCDAGLYKDGTIRQQCSFHNGVYTAPDGSETVVTQTGFGVPKAGILIAGLYQNPQASGSCAAASQVRIYSLKFYDDEVLAANFIPCLRSKDNTPGFYDDVSDIFYPARGALYGSTTGTDLGSTDTIAEALVSVNNVYTDERAGNSRLIPIHVNRIKQFEDGEQLAISLQYASASQNSTTLEISHNYHTPNTNSEVWIRVIYADGSVIDYPAYYSLVSRLTTHYGTGTIIHLTVVRNIVGNDYKNYAGRAMICDANYNTDGNDNARYVQWYNNIYSKKAIRNASIIVGDEDGYEEIGDDVTFDLSYPILWRTAALAINKTDYQYSYTLIYDRTLSTCYQTVSGIKNQVLYLVGEPNGGRFTVKSPLLTFNTPTEADGLYYIPIGKLGNQSTGQNYLVFSTTTNPTMFAYIGDAFQQVQGLVVRTTNRLNETIDTVTEHTRKIGLVETAVETKADSSTVETVSSNLSTLTQTVEGQTLEISSMQSTLSNKADSSTVQTVSNNLSTLTQTVSGQTQTISSMQSTLNTKADSSTVTTLSTNLSTLSNTVEGNSSSIQSLNTETSRIAEKITLEKPYKEVEWVESDGHQFVQLDWVPNLNGAYGFELDFENYNTRNATQPAWNATSETNRASAGFIFGARDGTTTAVASKQFSFGCYNPGYFLVGTATNYDPHMYYDGRRQQCSYHNSVYTAPNGQTYNYPCGTVHPTWGMVIFALPSNATKSAPYFPSSTKLYSCKFYDGDTLEVDLVGAIRTSDNMTGLYDKVAGKFWACAGLKTGNVVAELGEPPTLLEQSLATNPVVIDSKTAASRLWTADAPTISKLEDGQQITFRIKWPSVSEAKATELAGLADAGANTNVYLQLTLKDGSLTDWVPCYYLGATRLTTHYVAGTDLHLTYHENRVFGTSAIYAGWWADANYDTNTNTNTVTDKIANSVVAGKNGITNYSLVMKDDEGNWTSLMTPAGTALTKVTYTGPLQFQNVAVNVANGNYAAGANTGDGIFNSYAVDIRYSMNVANNATTGLTARVPLYIVGEVHADGYFYLDEQWWTQTEPTTEDGKTYIYLGIPYSYYQIWLASENTLYRFIDGEFAPVYIHTIERSVNRINEVTDTVTEHTRKIGAIETTVENKADSSTVTTVSNNLNSLSQTVSGQAQTISSLQSTVANKADGSTVTSLSSRVNDISDTVDGHTSQLSATTTSLTTLRTDFDNLEIGGRNLIGKFNWNSVYTYYSISDTGIVSSNSTDGSAWGYANSQWKVNLEAGSYCFSIFVDTVCDTWIYAKCEIRDSSNTVITDILASVFNNGGKEIKTFDLASAGYIGIKIKPGKNCVVRFKLEKGNKATDWSPAPEDLENYADNAANAVPRMSKINTAQRTFTTDQWKTYGAYGHTENWNTGSSYDNSHLRVGDRAYLTGTISDQMRGSATIIGKVIDVLPAGSGTSSVRMQSEQLIFGGDTVSAIQTSLSETQTDYATFKQTTQNFESTIGSTYATKEELTTTVEQATQQYVDVEAEPFIIGDDGINAPLRSVEANGWSEQFTTTGKNLLEVTATSQTINGVTFTVNADKSVTCNGTADDNAVFALNSQRYTSVDSDMVVSGSTGGSNATYAIILDYYVTGSAVLQHRLYRGDTGLLVKLSTGTTWEEYKVGIFIASGQTVSGLTFYPQIELGSTATAYEPYTGGAPSPSPDYPQEIKVARGRNFIDESRFIDGYYIAADDIITANQNLRYYPDYIEVDGQFSLRYDKLATTSSPGGVVTYYDTNKAYISRIVVQSGTTAAQQFSVVLVPPENARYVRIHVPVMSENVQLELGQVNPYVPYRHVGIDVKPKNLWVTDLGLWRKPVNYTICDVRLEQGKTYTLGLRLREGKNPQPVENSTDTYVGVLKSGTQSSNTIYAARVWQRYATNPKEDVTFTVDEAYTEPKLFFWDTSRARLVLDSYEAVLVEGDHIPENYPHWFAPTSAPVPMPSKGWAGALSDGTADVLMLDWTGRWEWTNNTAMVDLGTLTWDVYSGTTYRANVTGKKYANDNIMSDGYLYTGALAGNLPDYGMTGTTQANLLYARNDAAADAMEMKAACTDLTLMYGLATPTTESGYITMPTVYPGCTVSIPELDEVGISYWTPASKSLVDNTRLLEERVSNAETSIDQNKDQIALRAKSEDVYTKIETDGLISTEVSNRNAAIQLSADGINTEVSKKADKATIISTIRQSAETVKIKASQVEIDGTAIFTSISSDVDSAITSKGYATTTQVNTAKSEAISTAASDATSKANAAEQNAKNAIPTDISELNNDTGFITDADVPTKVSDLTNDSGFQTSTQVNTAITSKGYQTSSQVESAITSKGYATTTQAQGYADTAESNAKTYAADQASTVNSALESYKSITNSTLTSLQNQVDGQIEAWYKTVDPTSSNEPASTWNTNELKARHEGDLYYNVNNGHSWRWMKSGSSYSWQQIPDSDAAAALAAGQNAQTLANSKRRIFTSTPTVPYDTGDLWVDGSKIKYANASKTESQTYSSSDWVITATDDSATNALEESISNNLTATHRVYYRTSTANNSLTAPSTWVDEATGNVYNQWTTKVPPLASSTAAGQTKYLYLYTCEQRRLYDGTIQCTKVQLDENATVIDGGRIITNSITATQIAAGSITANEIDATNLHVAAANIDGTLAATQINASGLSIGYSQISDTPAIPTKTSDLQNDSNYVNTTQLDNKVDAIEIGGRNLLTNTDVFHTTITTGSNAIVGGFPTQTIPAGSDIIISMEIDATDIVWNSTSPGHRMGCQVGIPKSDNSGTQLVEVWAGETVSLENNVVESFTGTFHKRISKAFTLQGDWLVSNSIHLYCQAVASGTMSIGRIKVEYGNKATDWTPSAEELTEKSYVTISVSTINYQYKSAQLRATLYVNGVAKTSGVTYQWSKGGTAISGATSRDLTITNAMGLAWLYSCTVSY